MFVVYKNMPFVQFLINVPFLAAGILIKWLFFVQKGMGTEYLKGILAGMSRASTCKKVTYRAFHLPHYLKIQLELWANCIRLLGNIG
jgi:hypothetical protein